jgi:hypothetical protein
MVQFERRHGVTFASMRDDDGTLFARFGVPGQPAWVFVDRSGKVSTELGSLEEGELTARLGRLASS